MENSPEPETHRKSSTGPHVKVQLPSKEEEQSGEAGNKAGRKPASGKDVKKQMQEHVAEREAELALRNETYVLNYLLRKTHFDKEQVKALMAIYKAFKGSSQMDRLRFREMVASLFGTTDNIMLDRIFQAFDADNQGTVSESEWIIGLSIQLKGNLDEQIAYTYDVYDINGDRSLGRDEIQSCLRGCIVHLPGILELEEVDEATNEIVELAMRKFDLDHDAQIKFSEFRHIVRHDPLLLEAFGDCLPHERAAVPFVALLEQNQRNYSSFLSKPLDSSWTHERRRYNAMSRPSRYSLKHDRMYDEDIPDTNSTSSPYHLWSMSTQEVDKDYERKGAWSQHQIKAKKDPKKKKSKALLLLGKPKPAATKFH
ncbi:unnamed protein product [Orchesella dallaii]|uniref:EF-hand domain-containing protein n=1 Tax=Orchesella dallaii TaxID=48710 RepID=A0ABP1R5M5_9HEXA